MRAVWALLLVAAAPANAEPINRFEEIYAWSAEEEQRAGVARLPEELSEHARIRGLPILEHPNRPISPDELEVVDRALQRVPELLLEQPPKAIIIGDEGLRGLPNPFAQAKASGPYIVLRDGFFAEKGMRQLDSAERARLLVHEWGHVWQYYHLDIARAGDVTLATHSTLLDGWPEAVGWQRKDEAWVLPESGKALTTKYGASAPIEDQAEAFSYLFLGRVGPISEGRLSFLENALGVDADALAKGRLPDLYPLIRLRKTQPRIETVLADLVGAEGDVVTWGSNQAQDADALLGQFSMSMLDRGFVEVHAPIGQVEDRGFSTWRGAWTYGEMEVRAGALLIDKPGGSVIILRTVTN